MWLARLALLKLARLGGSIIGEFLTNQSVFKHVSIALSRKHNANQE